MVEIILGIIVVILVILSVLVYVKVINPLIKIIKQLEAESGSDVKLLNIRKNGLAGRLVSAINKIIEKTSISGNEEAHENFDGLADLSAKSQKALELINQVSSFMKRTAEGSLMQYDNVDKSTAAMKEMAAGVNESAVNIQNTSELVSQTSVTASKGQEVITKAMEQMKAIDDKIGQLYKNIQELEQFSTEINKIVGIITGISSQTNLLALNASIEAARAGESGRGFSVVAKEVGKLAEQSSESAKQISALVENIQNKTKEAADSMDISVQYVREGTASVDSAGTAFNKVSENICDVEAKIEELASNSEQMSASTGEVTDMIDATRKCQDSGVNIIKKADSIFETEVKVIDDINKMLEAMK